MKSKIILGSLMAIASVSCAGAQQPDNYSLTVNLTPDEEGMYVYAIDYDSRAKIDSAIVDANGVAKMSGFIETPCYANIAIDGQRIGEAILEPATITLSPVQRSVESDGQLYGELNKINQRLSALAAEFRAIPNDSTAEAKREAIYNSYNEVIDSAMTANINNPIGLMFFVSKAAELDLAQLDAQLAKYPQFKSSKRIGDIREKLILKDETSVGKKYKDFEITQPDGTTRRLSDYVGNGHYTLVDFWASWCGPCIRETKVIKEIYDKYNGKGLEVLGVAVWDKPEDTLEAIKKHELPWNQIINAQTIPTDLYGINGIPCIILIAPDGTIVSRDKQDEDLVNDVEAAMSTVSPDTAQ